MAYNPNQRDYVADSLMAQKAGSFDYGQAQGPLASGMVGLGSAAPAMSPMTGPTLAGLPQTPGGGVPGSGIAPAGPSNVQLPPQRGGMQGAMPSMPMMGGLGQAPGLARAPGLGGMPPPGQQRRRPMY